MDSESPDLSLLFDDINHGELGEEDAEGDANSDFLDLVDIEKEDEDDSSFPLQQSRPPSTTDAVPLLESNLHEVFKYDATKLRIPWRKLRALNGL